ncbi:Gfo/Idh/MocA family protein [Uliginosibacterium sp. TH139]|uniref:Gfo/Idh/MocA family protein n=1 Tax=Uliginosibacterium sp. TH139 TaxID=2067453 RepID=UPI000C7B91D1|nr:Gfo/Idh/MocA family oxidoreductase [Uliginosibacterium sp. TH139]PLK50551.1 oxidoreductase [Uliginosibacterium sp. TH139]
MTANGNPALKIRWGILGCGEVTEVKSGPGFQKAAGAELVAVMRRNGELAADYARRHGIARSYDDAARLIADPEVDAVYVATPPGAHLPLALLCAEAGKPCYVEKPLSLNHAQSLQMVEAFSARGVPLFSAYYRRAMPRFQKIQALLASGAIGAPRYANLQLHQPIPAEDLDPDGPGWRVNPALSGGGRFVDMGSHQLDFFDYLFGPVKDVHGFAASHAGLPAEDTVSAVLRFENGISASASWCFAAGDRLDRCEIVGDAGRIVFATFDDSPVRLFNTEGEQAFAIPNPAHVQQPLIQNVTDCLLGRAEALSTGASAARTDAVIDRILGR